MWRCPNKILHGQGFLAVQNFIDMQQILHHYMVFTQNLGQTQTIP